MVKIFEDMPFLKLIGIIIWIITLAIIINRPFGAVLGFGIGLLFMAKYKTSVNGNDKKEVFSNECK